MSVWADVRKPLQPDEPPPEMPSVWATPEDQPVQLASPVADVRGPHMELSTETANHADLNKLANHDQMVHDINALNDVRWKQAHPWGSPENHPGHLGKLAHVFSTIGNIAGNIVAPDVMARIPGTQLGMKEREGELANQLDTEQQHQAENEEREAQTRNLDLQPQLKMAQQQLAREKQDEIENHHNDQIASQLRQHGFKQDETGSIVPLSYGEMSPQQQAAYDLKTSQQNLADANEELKRASNDPTSPTYQLALQKLAEAERGHQAAQMRAQAALMNAYAGNYGTDMHGTALPGAMLDAQGNPVGSHFASNVRPTGQERNKADMAASADQQIDDMAAIVQKRPDIFGPAAGRKTDFTVWIGSQDPDAQRFRAARTIAGDHLAGTFGGRSEAALNALDSAIGHFKDNPEAIQAGLNQLKEANHLFLERGTVHTVGGNNSEGEHEKPLGQTNKPDGVYEMNGKQYHVRAGKVYAH